MSKESRAENEFLRGLDLAARGKNDLAAKRFARAEKGGIDVQARLVNISKKDLETFKQRVTSSSDPVRPDRPTNQPFMTVPKGNVTTDESSISSEVTITKPPPEEDATFQPGPRPQLEGGWVSLTLCDNSTIEVWAR